MHLFLKGEGRISAPEADCIQISVLDHGKIRLTGFFLELPSLRDALFVCAGGKIRNYKTVFRRSCRGRQE
jgi:hypothetical protein